MLAVVPNTTPSQIEEVLKDTALYLGPSNEYGTGLVQTADAIKKLRLRYGTSGN